MADLSREEKDRLADQKMEEMRKKNELLRKRHEEIEADKRNANELSQKFAENPSPTAEPSTPPRRTQRQHSNKAEQARFTVRAKTEKKTPPKEDPVPLLNMATSPTSSAAPQSRPAGRRGYPPPKKSDDGQSNRGPLQPQPLISPSSENVPNYGKWKAEREEIDRRRLERSRANDGSWKREWDAHKIDQVDDRRHSGDKQRTQPQQQRSPVKLHPQQCNGSPEHTSPPGRGRGRGRGQVMNGTTDGRGPKGFSSPTKTPPKKTLTYRRQEDRRSEDGGERRSGGFGAGFATSSTFGSTAPKTDAHVSKSSGSSPVSAENPKNASSPVTTHYTALEQEWRSTGGGGTAIISEADADLDDDGWEDVEDDEDREEIIDHVGDDDFRNLNFTITNTLTASLTGSTEDSGVTLVYDAEDQLPPQPVMLRSHTDSYDQIERDMREKLDSNIEAVEAALNSARSEEELNLIAGISSSSSNNHERASPKTNSASPEFELASDQIPGSATSAEKFVTPEPEQI